MASSLGLTRLRFRGYPKLVGVAEGNRLLGMVRWLSDDAELKNERYGFLMAIGSKVPFPQLPPIIHSLGQESIWHHS